MYAGSKGNGETYLSTDWLPSMMGTDEDKELLMRWIAREVITVYFLNKNGFAEGLLLGHY